MPSTTSADYITIELHVRASLLRDSMPMGAREKLEEDDALAVMLGRQALAMGRTALHEADVDPLQ